MSDLAPDTTGYKQPPASHRFKKGLSGNPKGRPKTLETPYTALQKVLKRKVPVTGGGQIAIQDALLLRLRDLALAGDRRAVALQQHILAMARPGLPEEGRANVKSAGDRFMELIRANPEWAEELRDDDEN